MSCVGIRLSMYVCMSSVGVHQDIEHVLLFRFRVTFI